MNYVHGATINKPALAAKTADEVRAPLEHLNRIRAAVITETAAKESELARIRAARKRLEPVATYKPNAEQLAYRDEHAATIAKQPSKHGGPAGLRAATREIETHYRKE